jgi:PPOX class probable F420-dependent enzyme
MTRAEILAFLRSERLGVVSTLGADGGPQAAVVGLAVTDELELVFDAIETTRKVCNLRRDPRIAVAIGWEREITVQLEGVADEPMGAERERVRAAYFASFPDGRARLGWAGLTHVRIRPRWARYSNFAVAPPLIAELAL